MEQNKKEIGGVFFDVVTMGEALSCCEAFLEQPHCKMVVTPNAEIGYECMVDEETRTLINSADLVIPDGAGVVLASKIIKDPLPGNVPGADLAQKLIPILEKRGEGVFFFGSKPGVAEQAAQRLKEQFPKLIISGTNDGYFKEEASIVEKIATSGAAVLFVCLGFPKQEQFIAQYRDELNVRIALGLGGTLDVIAGVVKRAPKFYQKLHIEFLYRLLKEPKRLGRMMRIPKYLWRVRNYKK